MDSATLFAAQLNQDIYTIDLHHIESMQSALEVLERDLYGAYKMGEPYCRVVHGIGTGKLASAAQDALEKNPLIAEWKKEESGGSCLVVF